MRQLSKVVWSEGMHLAPHHFQLQGRYFEDAMEFAVSSLWFAPYGLAGCRWDEEALRNGTVSLTEARGLLQDGLAFQMPEQDPLPEPRPIRELFPPTRDALTILLAVPAQRSGGRNALPAEEGANSNGNPPRYWAERRVVADETTGRDERAVDVGRKNLRLLLDIEVDAGRAEGEVLLPVARVVRDGAGHYVYDPEYVPPCVDIGASASLLGRLERLVEVLEEKSAVLAPTLSRAGWAERGSGEISRLWMRHSVNAALPGLRHLLTSRRGHPELLWRELSRLGGALCTFGANAHPRDLPLYDHDRLGARFGDLDRRIRELLEAMVPTGCLAVSLRPSSEASYWEGEVGDSRCLASAARWVLGVRAAGIGEADLIGRVPRLLKFCSRKFVPKLVERALPGLPLLHLSVPPPQIPARVDTQYFSVSRAGPCWDHLLATREVGVYVPAEVPDVEMELWVVRDE